MENKLLLSPGVKFRPESFLFHKKRLNFVDESDNYEANPKFLRKLWKNVKQFCGINCLCLPRFWFIAVFKSFSTMSIVFLLLARVCGFIIVLSNVLDSFLWQWFTNQFVTKDYSSAWKYFFLFAIYIYPLNWHDLIHVCSKNIFLIRITINYSTVAVVQSFRDLITNTIAWFYRKELTKHSLKDYFTGRSYYTILNLKGPNNSITNPDQNIVRDCEDFCNSRARIEVESLSLLFKILFSYAVMIMTGVHPLLFAVTLVWPIIFLVTYSITIPFSSQFLTWRKHFEGRFRHSHSRIKEHCESMAFGCLFLQFILLIK